MTVTPQKTKKNIPALTSIRGFAAIAVVLMHINSTYAEQGLLFFSLFQYSSLGVDLFFILSGFILAYVYEEQNFSKLGIKSFFVTFMSARLARIYPLHIVTLLFTLLIVLTLSGFSERYSEHFFTLQSFILNVFLIQNWGLVDISWNTVSWSISAEFFMYLLFPFMLYFKSFINNTNHIIMLTLLCFVAHHLFIFVLDWSSYGGMSLGGMVRVFFEFSLGFLFFFLRLKLKTYFQCCTFKLSYLILPIMVSAMLIEQLWFFFLPSAVMLIVYLSVMDCKIGEVLSYRPCIYLGNISYSLYMWHWLVIQINNWLKSVGIYTTSDNYIVYFECFSLVIVSVIIAHYSFRYIEQPARKWGRKVTI